MRDRGSGLEQMQIQAEQNEQPEVFTIRSWLRFCPSTADDRRLSVSDKFYFHDVGVVNFLLLPINLRVLTMLPRCGILRQ